MNPNFLIRLFGTMIILGLCLWYIPGFQTVDLFTFIVIVVGVALIELLARPFIELQTLVFTPVTVGAPLFLLTLALLLLLNRYFPGFSVTGYWQIPITALAVSLVHAVAETFTHTPYQNK
jgi:uncharacterized membrane protein YvlD (DUF360 family)